MPEKIGKHKLKAKAIASAVIDSIQTGETYTDIGHRFYPNSARPRAAVYQALHRPDVQAELREKVVEIQDSELKERLLSFIRREKQDSLTLKALELGMRHKALLIDKQIQERRELAPIQDLGGVDTDKLAEELTSRLRLSAQGVETGQNGPNPCLK